MEESRHKFRIQSISLYKSVTKENLNHVHTRAYLTSFDLAIYLLLYAHVHGFMALVI